MRKIFDSVIISYLNTKRNNLLKITLLSITTAIILHASAPSAKSIAFTSTDAYKTTLRESKQLGIDTLASQLADALMQVIQSTPDGKIKTNGPLYMTKAEVKNKTLSITINVDINEIASYTKKSIKNTVAMIKADSTIQTNAISSSCTNNQHRVLLEYGYSIESVYKTLEDDSLLLRTKVIKNDCKDF